MITRPYWQHTQDELHVKANGRDLMGKSLLQVCLASAYVSLLPSDSALHACFFVAASVLYALFVFLKKTYNYGRVNLWARLQMIGVVCYGATGLVQQYSSEQATLSYIILMVLSSILVVVGVAAQTCIPAYCSLLTREKNDKYDIIKFAFTFGKLAQEHLQNFRQKQAKYQLARTVGEQVPSSGPLSSTVGFAQN
jgi:hypothetical protein